MARRSSEQSVTIVKAIRGAIADQATPEGRDRAIKLLRENFQDVHRNTWGRLVKEALGAPREVGKPALPSPGTEPDHTRVGAARKALKDKAASTAAPKTSQLVPAAAGMFGNVGGVTMRHTLPQALPMPTPDDILHVFREGVLDGQGLMDSALDKIDTGGHLVRDPQSYSIGVKLKIDAATGAAKFHEKLKGYQKIEHYLRFLVDLLKQDYPETWRKATLFLHEKSLGYRPGDPCQQMTTSLYQPSDSSPKRRGRPPKAKLAPA